MVLSHAGINQDRGLSWSARGLVDLIVGGHTHDLLTEGDRDQGLPIAQAGWNAEHLGRITLEVDEDGVRVVDMRLEAVPESAPGDPVVLAELEACDRDLDAWLDEPVAWLPDPVPHSESADSAVARLTAEALLARRPGDIGVLMAAHCRAGLPAGTVTRRDVWAATSSPGNLATATLTGAQVRAMVRRGQSEEFATTRARTFRGLPYGRLGVVGVDVDGDRVLVGDEPLDDARAYAVTGSDLELSPYGTLVERRPDDLVVHAPAILPEILEAHLRDRFPVPDPRLIELVEITLEGLDKLDRPAGGAHMERSRQARPPARAGGGAQSFFWNSPRRWTGRKPIASLTPIMWAFTSAL